MEQVGLLDRRQVPAGLRRAPREQPAAGVEQVAGAVEQERPRQSGQVGQRGGDLRAAEVVGRARPPQGVRLDLAVEEPRVDRVRLARPGRRGGQVRPRRVQDEVRRGGQVAVAHRQRHREREPAAGRVARQHDPTGFGGPAGGVRDEGIVGVGPGVLGSQGVVGHHDPGADRVGQPGGVPHVDRVDRRHEGAAVDVVERAVDVAVARRQDVGREPDVVDRDVPVLREAGGRPGRQASILAAVVRLDAGPLGRLALEVPGVAQPGDEGRQERVAKAGHAGSVGVPARSQYAGGTRQGSTRRRAESADQPQTLRT